MFRKIESMVNFCQNHIWNVHQNIRLKSYTNIWGEPAIKKQFSKKILFNVFLFIWLQSVILPLDVTKAHIKKKYFPFFLKKIMTGFL